MLSFPDNAFDWFDLEWFRLATLQSFEWINPIYLYLLPLVPFIFLVRWLTTLRFRKKLDIAFFEGKAKWHWTSILRYIPDIIFGMFALLVMVALARPQRINEVIEQSSEGIDIMLVLDTSGSMELKDFKPNRLDAAKEVALRFIKGRFQDRIGVVVFAGDAYSLAPLTTDYDLLRETIKGIHFKMIPNDGTAIGSALGVAINRMREAVTKSKVCILISDGENTGGNIEPAVAARLAHAFNIRIYTIGIGEDGRVPFDTNEKGEIAYVNTRLDETNLREIAQVADGQFFRATTTNALQEIFRKINLLEKSEIKELRFRNNNDYYQIYLKWAILFLLLWLLSKNTFLSNALED
ncbi:vWA domain-containing protein [Adhaeribacter radiodurans]|uniref:VWA domain-containing protein n=1 Tax=Adhaeribacter radiodurans TaxID=2745197 RepID=A0A7L7L7J3_9BACT|nr:VWA domain-containing protein [Adhaeribacter radiodurans]QMU28505.1 VWA domain-containing protein [Adhaeribacter radiodurans]